MPFRNRVTLAGLVDDSMDISPDQSGSILKRVIRPGNPSRIPQRKDNVEISWKIWLNDGSLAHNSNVELDEGFSFQLGADPREVIQGWETAVYTMREGEVAKLTIEPEYAFGITGAEPMVPANETISCELCLERIIPAIARAYQSVGMNESIKDELMEKIQSRESPIAEEAMANKVVNETKAVEEIRYFDEAKHKVDPNLSVMGEGQGFMWEESVSSIDVEVPLLDGIQKKDLVVQLESRRLRVRLASGEVLLEGPLHGTINTMESGWVIVEADPSARTKMRGRKLVVSMEKTYSSREIWSSLFDREFIKEKQGMENQ